MRGIFTRFRYLALLVPLIGSCKQKEPAVAALPQRAYVWQRDWNPRVTEAVARSQDRLAGCVVLACEIEWDHGQPRPVRPSVNWASLGRENFSISPAIRVMPYPGPFSDDDEIARFLCATARREIEAIRAAGVEPLELQLDFDCAQKKLAGYAKWVRAVRREISPLPLVITALPSWLEEPEFPGLVSSTSSYVLQVHSIPTHKGSGMVCDPAMAVKWVGLASRLDVPFEISLPTYRITAGYDLEGGKIGSYSDAVRPAWPPGTRVQEFSTDLNAMAALVARWQSDHPRSCKGLLWYRLPVEGDRQNCPWPSFRAMTEGRAPIRKWEVGMSGGGEAASLIDLSLINTGETDDLTLTAFSVTWDQPATLSLVEPLTGWRVSREDSHVNFTPTQSSVRLSVGASRAIGWLRFDRPTHVHVEVLSETR
jgi:hypothetical protein